MPTAFRVLLIAATAWRATLAQGHPGHPSPPVRGADTSISGLATRAMGGHHDAVSMLHMEMTAVRRATSADSAKAWAVVKELRAAIGKYKDTATAIADGYAMFLPHIKEQKIFHFTNNGLAIKEAFRFDAAKPTSLLYQRTAKGTLELVGAMYTMPKRTAERRLNDRIPLSIGRWHRHVNWCLPRDGDAQRWLERKDGRPLFGPESTVATKKECAAIKGEFRESIFGWMIHANVFAGDDLATIFGD